MSSTSNHLSSSMLHFPTSYLLESLPEVDELEGGEDYTSADMKSDKRAPVVADPPEQQGPIGKTWQLASHPYNLD